VIRKIIPYNPRLKEFARQLRNNSTQSEIKLWKRLRGKQMLGFDFHRQKPIDEYIVDFFCYELMLAIELDGLTHQWEEVYIKDLKKEKRITELGITVMRFSDSQVMNDIENVLRVIEDYATHYGK
jgi:very-short-patch-repair endonuclease